MEMLDDRAGIGAVLYPRAVLRNPARSFRLKEKVISDQIEVGERA